MSGIRIGDTVEFDAGVYRGEGIVVGTGTAPGEPPRLIISEGRFNRTLSKRPGDVVFVSRPQSVRDALLQELVFRRWDAGHRHSSFVPHLNRVITGVLDGSLTDEALASFAERQTGNDDAALSLYRDCKAVVRGLRDSLEESRP